MLFCISNLVLWSLWVIFTIIKWVSLSIVPWTQSDLNLDVRKREALAQVFSCEFCEISKNTFFTEHLWATASIKRKLNFNDTHCVRLFEAFVSNQPFFCNYREIIKQWNMKHFEKDWNKCVSLSRWMHNKIFKNL